MGNCLGKTFYARDMILDYCKDDKTSPVSLEPKSHVVLEHCSPFLPQGWQIWPENLSTNSRPEDRTKAPELISVLPQLRAALEELHSPPGAFLEAPKRSQLQNPIYKGLSSLENHNFQFQCSLKL